jgi:ribosomal protein S8
MGRLDICNVVVLAMKEFIANAENIKMRRSKKEEIIQLLEKVNGKSKIEGYNEVLKDILLIQGVDDWI